MSSPEVTSDSVPEPRAQVVRVELAGDSCSVRLERAEPHPWPELPRDLTNAAMSGSGGRKAAERIVQLWQERVGRPNDWPVLLVCTANHITETSRLRAILTTAFPEAKFVVTTDPRRALRNLAGLGPVRTGGQSHVCPILERDSLRRDQYQAITGSPGSPDDGRVAPERPDECSQPQRRGLHRST